jgi:hypothetical protein
MTMELSLLKSITGTYTVAELVSIRDRRIAWTTGTRSEQVAAEDEVRALCDDAIGQISQDGDASAAEIKEGVIVSLVIVDEN